MSLPPATYASQPSSYPTNYRPQNPPYDNDTPPPPPPKPNSHEASRRGTPQTGPPLPPPPPSSLSHEISWTQQSGVPNDHNSAPPHQDQSSNPNPQIPPPNIEDGWIPDILKDKSTTDLTTILSSPSLLTSLSTLHPSHPSSQSHLTTLLQTNTSLTTHLQSLESHLSTLRNTTSSLLLQHQSLELSWRKKQTEMDTSLEPWSPKALYQRLVAAVAEQEAVCRAVEESFLEGEEHGGHGHGQGYGHGHEGGGRASEREVVEWVKRIKAEGAKLEARREARARWDEGRVGGWR
ncbi:hypothetical protein FQN54_005693 [Arachnomyces sp. PD_36]|nr:hypothetical protein FQN54_005693 [Arachnomyces sp. PD_36]